MKAAGIARLHWNVSSRRGRIGLAALNGTVQMPAGERACARGAGYTAAWN
jgi:hypothetical protein